MGDVRFRSCKRKPRSCQDRQRSGGPIALNNDQLSIYGALVTSAHIGSSNGLIHGIDKVNIPTKQ